jgi:SagB-type dehydrogenase family enzyme
MSAGLAVGLVPGATVGRGNTGAFVRVHGRTLSLGRECPRWAVAALASGPRSERELVEETLDRRGFKGLKSLYSCLEFLRSRRLLGYALLVRGQPLVTWIPDGADPQTGTARPSPRRPVVLSRFAYCRRDGDLLVLESPLAPGQLVLHGEHSEDAWRAIGQLSRPTLLRQAIDESPLPPKVARQLLNLLWRRQFLSEAEGTRPRRKRQDRALATWEFHDLLFHTRSRHGRHRNGYGARPSSLWRGFRDPPTARPRPADIVRLPSPDLDRLRREDAPFTAVMEDRRTVRVVGPSPLTIADVGEFLYRTGRARQRRGPGPKATTAWFDRVAPTGGAAYELDVYLAIRQCRGLRPGLYRYDPRGHALWRRAGMTPDVRRMTSSAGHAARTTPQVLIIVSARFGRTLRRYASMAYAMILKDAGVLLQTFYLVATAMGLAPCAIGGGDSDDFVRAAGTTYYEETSVGEFLLGRSNRRSSAPRGVPNPVHGSQPRGRAR